MKKWLILFCCVWTAACSSLLPYKDQNLDYLQGIEKNPNAYRGQVVAFGGEVKGITEDTLRLRLVLKIDAPLYYYATGKGNAFSYEMLLVSFNKRGMPAMTGIKKGHTVKVLARVSNYETRKNFTGKDIAVLHLIAFALADHTTHRDFFRPESPDRQLYESWKEGRLFFEESAQDVISRCPAAKPAAAAPVLPTAAPQPSPAAPAPEKGIVFDEEEPPFILPPDPQTPTVCPENEPEPSAAPQPEPAQEPQSAGQPTPADPPAAPSPAPVPPADCETDTSCKAPQKAAESTDLAA